jgi:hypothetical protein
MLREALTDLARRDQEHLVGALERLLQASRVGVVGAPYDHPALGEIGELVGTPTRGHDLAGRKASLEQRLNDETSEMTGCTGDDN